MGAECAAHALWNYTHKKLFIWNFCYIDLMLETFLPAQHNPMLFFFHETTGV